ncbi:MAG: hypothetical protein DRG73_00625, partial [Deltaproteobacteria bacterium]
VPEENLRYTVLMKYNDIVSIRQKLGEDSDIAGVILDPHMSMGGLFPAGSEYIREVRKLTKERDVVLIFDEHAWPFGHNEG